MYTVELIELHSMQSENNQDLKYLLKRLVSCLFVKLTSIICIKSIQITFRKY